MVGAHLTVDTPVRSQAEIGQLMVCPIRSCFSSASRRPASTPSRAGITVAGSLAEIGTITELASGEHAGSTISCSISDALRDAELPVQWDHEPLQVDDARITEGQLRIETNDPCQVTYELLGWARHHGVRELSDFRVVQPSLEETYLRLVHEADQRAAQMAPAAEGGR
jgi:hypothetical protein